MSFASYDFYEQYRPSYARFWRTCRDFNLIEDDLEEFETYVKLIMVLGPSKMGHFTVFYSAIERCFLHQAEKLKPFLLVAANIAADFRHAPSRYSPLYGLAQGDENIDLMQALLDHGEDIHVRQPSGDTVLHAAVSYRIESLKLVQFLCSKGADIHARNNREETVLHALLKHASHVRLVKWLIENGIDVNAKAHDSIMPLHILLSRNKDNDLKVVEELVKNGVDVNAVDAFGRTPLQLARGRDAPKIVALLLENGSRCFTGDAIGTFYKPTSYLRCCIVDKLIIKFSFVQADLSKPYGFAWNECHGLDLYPFTCEEYERACQRFKERCLHEVEDMKMRILDNNLSVWDFFFKYRLEHPDYVFGGAFFQFRAECNPLFTRYPIYKDVLERIVVTKSKNFWVDLLTSCPAAVENSQGMEGITLHTYCWKEVSDYLSKEDLVSLVAAFDIGPLKPKRHFSAALASTPREPAGQVPLRSKRKCSVTSTSVAKEPTG